MKTLLLLILSVITFSTAFAQYPKDGKFRNTDSLKNYINSQYPKKPASNDDLKLQRTMRGMGDIIKKFDSTTYKTLTKTVTIDFASQAAQTSGDSTVTVTGAAVGDVVILAPPGTVLANCSFTAWVSATNTVTIRFNNYSAGAINPASGSYKLRVFKQ